MDDHNYVYICPPIPCFLYIYSTDGSVFAQVFLDGYSGKVLQGSHDIIIGLPRNKYLGLIKRDEGYFLVISFEDTRKFIFNVL